ncbi:hypothetical protein D1AOALGA4SA_12988 [Olavius algarvensis Delta 1 endosymbiont]|nr:hypothetical protein D1AOALGA4SA_12988 [Olavius algarvensis Delta 1 endosymbiont]
MRIFTFMRPLYTYKLWQALYRFFRQAKVIIAVLKKSCFSDGLV